MKFVITLVVLSVCAVLATAEIEVRSNYDLIINSLPLYGGTKLSKVLSPQALDKTVGFFKKHPKKYESLKTQVANKGVFLPEINNLKLDLITAEDFKTLNNLIGSTTLREAFNIEFAKSIYDKISNDEELVERLKMKIKQSGITFNEGVDAKTAIKALVDAFEPIVPSFATTGMSIIILG